MSVAAKRAKARSEEPLPYPKFKTRFSEFIGIGANGHLWVEGRDTVELAAKYGTPLYVWSENQLRHNYRRFRDAWITSGLVRTGMCRRTSPSS